MRFTWNSHSTLHCSTTRTTATEAAPRTARTTAQVQVRTRYHPRIVSRETVTLIGDAAPAPTATRHPQTRNHASTAHQRPATTSGVPPLGSTPLNHSRTPTPRAFLQSRTPAAPHAHTRSARRDLPPQSPAATHPRQTSLTPASPAASARGPHASARRPRRARSTR